MRSPFAIALTVFLLNVAGRQLWHLWADAYDVCVGISFVAVFAHFFSTETNRKRRLWIAGMLWLSIQCLFKEFVVDPTRMYVGEVVIAALLLCAILRLTQTQKA